jgi:hypothetical protein
MHKSATKCNETVGKWCKNNHGASKIIDTLETYQCSKSDRCMSHFRPERSRFPAMTVPDVVFEVSRVADHMDSADSRTLDHGPSYATGRIRA